MKPIQTTHNFSFNRAIPEVPDRDKYGVKIEQGARVAFNLSGDVVIGTIVEIKKNEWMASTNNWLYHKFHMIVDVDGEKRNCKNINSFVVI